ncbi:hypothetical protein chmu038 [Choristoneura murinana nucleopolyhedrovirus]|uniref:Uncharacterized protein n=1 Tax=Choristoneura murinana nucleopolyhedrovirus TaxID=1987479 RepID=V9XTG5_9ABAC|nr:hypothetical protein chmu038 [Choristoneura murinana nucleopolyhedrovirus]AHD25525.1 hypothetical protein chmu038 [Choristoneura murinana nucleopolyhedrovirus]BBU37516.1 hypothetical protein [Choristoneura diversana nucleopolyhedrovirus]
MKLLLILFALVVAALASRVLPDPLAPPPKHANHLAGAPNLRPRGRAYNAAEQKLQQCRMYLN